MTPPAIVMVSAVGLALKDHGRARTLKGLRDGDDGRTPAGHDDPSGSGPCHGPLGPGRVSQSRGAPAPSPRR